MRKILLIEDSTPRPKPYYEIFVLEHNSDGWYAYRVDYSNPVKIKDHEPFMSLTQPVFSGDVKVIKRANIEQALDEYLAELNGGKG